MTLVGISSENTTAHTAIDTMSQTTSRDVQVGAEDTTYSYFFLTFLRPASDDAGRQTPLVSGEVAAGL